MKKTDHRKDTIQKQKEVTMSKIPEVPKAKYNQKDPFAWVDYQWEKFMTEQKELKKIVTQLQEDLITCNKHFQSQREELIQLRRKYECGTPTDGLEFGNPEDYGDEPLIYESPDGGKTIYQRRVGDTEKTLVVRGDKQMELF